jgi:hypothetical protein
LISKKPTTYKIIYILEIKILLLRYITVIKFLVA